MDIGTSGRGDELSAHLTERDLDCPELREIVSRTAMQNSRRH
jgi:hypothetical protein